MQLHVPVPRDSDREFVRDAAARAVDLPHLASVLIEVLAHGDPRVRASPSAGLCGRRGSGGGR